jgi:preprotein translocase subunit YajC
VDPSGLIFLVLMIAIFYFLLIRPQKRRADQHRSLVNSLSVGDEVVTIGGVFGTVRRLRDEELDLEVAPGTTMRLLKSAVARRVTEDVDQSAGPQATSEDETP